MAEELNVQSTETPAEPQEKTFSQAEVDALIQKRLERERKKYPNDEELSAFRSWQESQQTEQEKWNNLTRERDESRAALESANKELEQLKRANYVASKGFSGEEAEFIAFKAAKMVDDKTTFEKAVDSLTADRKKATTFDWTAPVGGNNNKQDANAAMNALIRNAFK